MLKELSLDLLKEQIPALSRNVGNYLSEAAAYCLSKNDHESGTILPVSGTIRQRFSIKWSHQIDQAVERSWQDTKEAVEYGATGVAFLLLKSITRYHVIERSFQGTGFDYWLSEAPFDENSPPFIQRKAKLEVSGIWKEHAGNTLERRLGLKLKQVAALSTKIPVVIIVVEFGEPKAKYLKR